MLAYALRRTASEADAEDVVAETFAIAWRRKDALPTTDRALPWLLAVARRVAANQRRGTTRWRALLERVRSQPQPGAIAPVPETPATDALLRLRPDDQELLRLLAWDGLTHAEVGVVLGISPNAVAIRLLRARRWFTDELAAIEADDLKGSAASRTSSPVRGGKPGQPAEERTT